jgi:sialate O-acetylesterase
MNNILLISVIIFSLSFQLYPKVKLASIISDNSILQRNKIINIWGKADNGEKVTVSLGSQTKVVFAGADNHWLAKLDPMTEGGPYELKINEIILKNILIGEVWFCSGQSNMGLSVKNAANGSEEISNADYPKIRLFVVKNSVMDTEQFFCKGNWVECSPNTIGNFSAAAYYFGRELYQELNIPIGLIQSCVGGTAAECWMDKKVLESDELFKPILSNWEEKLKNYPFKLVEFNENYKSLIEKWQADSIIALNNGRMPPRKPSAPDGPGSRNTPSGLYNGMIAPLIPYSIQGVIWYQGEANVKRPYQYRKLFPALINSWREKWGIGDFPFYYVQLPNLNREPEPSKSGWAQLRESQLMSLNVPNTGMITTIDIGESVNLHPKNKQEVGRRLALIALAKLYEKKNYCSGPIFKSMKIDGSLVRLSFDNIADGLIVKGSDILTGFKIASGDKNFLSAEAKIEGNEILVWNKKINSPIAVRYAWADDPQCNLFNSAFLPASPFRTDDWPGIKEEYISNFNTEIKK